MKLTLCSAIGLSLLLASCSSLDPEYAEWKKQQEAQAAGQAPYGQPNAYGVPGAPADTSGAYAQLPTIPNAPAAPEPIPPLNPTPGPAPVPFPGSGPGLSPTPGPAPLGNTVPHMVVKGDSLWALSRRYGTSVEAIQAANGMGGTDIQAGTTLQIPSNN